MPNVTATKCWPSFVDRPSDTTAPAAASRYQIHLPRSASSAPRWIAPECNRITSITSKPTARGTELGDPIEMQAAASVLGENRETDRPLLVSSVKTNIGHLEAAAGIAGLIKVLLAFQHDVIPPQKNFDVPNPHIPWDQLPVNVVVEPTAWPRNNRRIAGVSAFGMSGTNAHVVLEGPRENGHIRPSRDRRQHDKLREESNGSPETPQLLVLSAKTDSALRDLAAVYRQWLQAHKDADLADVAYTTGARRRHLEIRAALVSSTNEQARGLLDHLERSASHSDLYEGIERRTTPKVAWQFTGQGSQYLGMSKELYATQSVFRDAIVECERSLRQWREERLTDVLFRHEELIDHTRWTQPALFAVQMGLTRLLESWGLQPDVVLGHSVGQYAAACVAGILSWEDGLRMISERGRLIGELPTGGAMMAIFAPEDDVQTAIATRSAVSLAALNGTHTVISGPQTDLEEIARDFQDRDIRCTSLTTSHAFHSPLMEPVLEPFQQVADQLRYQTARIPLICNVTGEPLPVNEIVTGAYWRRHIREPVRFADSISAVNKLGCEVLLEVGPKPVLTNMAAATWQGNRSGLICCLQSDQKDQGAMLSAVAQLYVHGVTPDFNAIDHREERNALVLPTYPFQRRRFWGPAKPQARQAEEHSAHPLLGGKLPLAGRSNETRYESWVAADRPAWIADHQVMGDVVLPGAAYVEVALAAADADELHELKFEQPLRPASSTRMQTIVQSASDQKAIEVYSTPERNVTWTRHFSAKLSPTSDGRPTPVDRATIAQRCNHSTDASDFYQMMNGLRLHYGSQFQTVQSLQYSDSEILAHLKTTSDIRGYTIPPTLLDGAFHSLAVGMMHQSDASLFLPVGVERVRCFSSVDSEAWCHAQWTQPDGEIRMADLTLYDNSGNVMARLEGLTLRQLDRAALRKIGGSGPQRLLYRLGWQSSRLPAANHQPSQWLVVHSDSTQPSLGSSELGQLIVDQLTTMGQRAISVKLIDGLSRVELSDDSAQLSGNQKDHWDRLIHSLQDLASNNSVQGVVWLLGSEMAADEKVAKQNGRATQRHCSGLLTLIASLREHGVKHLRRGLQLVTRGGVAINEPVGEQQNDVHGKRPGRTSTILGAGTSHRCRATRITMSPHRHYRQWRRIDHREVDR